MFTYVAGKKLTVYVESAEQWHGGPLYSAIVQRCWDQGISGATVIRCEEGFGHRHVHHAARLWSLNDEKLFGLDRRICGHSGVHRLRHPRMTQALIRDSQQP